MKKYFSLLLLFSILITGTSCDKNEDIPEDLEIQNFIWKGLNLYYFWQQDLPDLSDLRFNSQDELNTYLDGNNPEELFYNLLNNYPTTDKYSWIVDDYIALEQQLQQGITGTTGVEFGLRYQTGSTTNLYGYVEYIIEGSDASAKDIHRGDIFYAVNGTPLTVNNYSDLLFSSESYTLNLATYNNGIPIDNGVSVSLTKTQIQENPILHSKTFDISGKKIGYLMYNSFTPTFDTQLNETFATLVGIDYLVLDLRYNSGGSVRTATYLASMITGQFTGELLTKEIWNDKWQNYFENSYPDYLINNFVDEMDGGTTINSLQLDKVIILTTGGSASASELIINGLNPYIDVVTIGTKTEGKYVASVTLYDSDNYRREGANPNHTWALQPIVLEEVNKLGVNDKDGFDPTILLEEDKSNLGQLGDITEPYLARAIQYITTGSRATTKEKIENHQKNFSNSKKHSLAKANMFIEKELIFIN